MPGSVIVAGARTPIGRLSGALKSFKAVDLGGLAIKAALDKAGVAGDQVDYVIMGHVLQAGAGQITARQAAVRGGIPMTVPAVAVNKVCLSGLDAIALADQLIGYGEFDVVVAGGMESMTSAPHLLSGARAGYRLGNGELVDSMMHDGLFCSFDQLGMGAATETYTKLANISREEQDAFSAASHGRAAAAMKNGIFDDEIVPVPVPQRKGDPMGSPLRCGTGTGTISSSKMPFFIAAAARPCEAAEKASCSCSAWCRSRWPRPCPAGRTARRASCN